MLDIFLLTASAGVLAFVGGCVALLVRLVLAETGLLPFNQTPRAVVPAAVHRARTTFDQFSTRVNKTPEVDLDNLGHRAQQLTHSTALRDNPKAGRALDIVRSYVTATGLTLPTRGEADRALWELEQLSH